MKTQNTTNPEVENEVAASGPTHVSTHRIHNFISKVLQPLVHPETKNYLLVETAQGKPLRVTPEHIVLSGGEYKPIGTLTIGSPLTLLKDGQLVPTEITAMRKIESTQTTYNLEIEGSHTYIADGYAVHNTKGPTNPLQPSG